MKKLIEFKQCPHKDSRSCVRVCKKPLSNTHGFIADGEVLLRFCHHASAQQIINRSEIQNLLKTSLLENCAAGGWESECIIGAEYYPTPQFRTPSNTHTKTCPHTLTLLKAMFPSALFIQCGKCKLFAGKDLEFLKRMQITLSILSNFP